MATPKTSPVGPAPLAYSYVRFSSPKQAEGDSLRRQTEKAVAWCERNGVRLDTSVTLHDLGKSAFTGTHRQNPDRHALAAFLKLVEQGRVPRGSVLLVESLDRLSREHIRPALSLLLNLIESGVRVVQLIPVEAVYDDKVEPMQLMMALMELSRGNSESRVKSERVGDAWAAKKKAARSNGHMLTAALPAWVETRGGKLRLIPARAKVVKKIFELSAAGYGLASLVRKLTEDGIEPMGRSGRWDRAYLSLILGDRRAVGECQPRKGKKPDGDPIPNYFPAVVTEEEWLAVRAGAAQRRRRPGRVGKNVNIFAGLIKSAEDGGTYYIDTQTSSNGKVKVRALVSVRADEGRARGCGGLSFRYDVFETAVLSLLKEINPADVLGTDDGPDEVAVLAGELAVLDAELAETAAFMGANGFSATIGKRVQDLETRRRGLVELLADARQRAACPAAEAWGELRSLADLLATAPDPTDMRLRIRSALRRVVTEAWMLVVKHGHTRAAAVQFYFTGGARRDFLIVHRAGHGPSGRPASTVARSFADAEAKGLDLRKPDHARKLEKALLELDLSTATGV